MLYCSKSVQNEENNINLLNQGERYLLRKILLGDVSDNIRPCNINKLLLDKNISNIQNIQNIHDIQNISGIESILECKVYKTINKTNIEILLQNNALYEFLTKLLDAIHTGDIKNSNDSRLVLIQNFYENTILMDFKMIPQNLQKELETKFSNYCNT